jgi:H+-transporting ATPase
MMERPTAHSSTSSEAPDHLRTNIPSGGFAHNTTSEINDDNDIHVQHSGGVVNEKAPAGDEGEDEDIDALIAELESEDGDDDDEDEAAPGMSARPIPEELLNTDTRKGLTSQEVTDRRKKYGLNQMAEEKENLILKFLGYFVGPIQFVMEVCQL